jgi:hypothetical protein
MRTPYGWRTRRLFETEPTAVNQRFQALALQYGESGKNVPEVNREAELSLDSPSASENQQQRKS